MEGGHMIGYHELRKISPEKAREVTRKVLEREGVMFQGLLVSLGYQGTR
jgi:hypothetical protein